MPSTLTSPEVTALMRPCTGLGDISFVYTMEKGWVNYLTSTRIHGNTITSGTHPSIPISKTNCLRRVLTPMFCLPLMSDRKGLPPCKKIILYSHSNRLSLLFFKKLIFFWTFYKVCWSHLLTVVSLFQFSLFFKSPKTPQQCGVFVWWGYLFHVREMCKIFIFNIDHSVDQI